jgi:hypothetical protein
VARWRRPFPWFLLLLFGSASCAQLTQCEIDRVRAEIKDYDRQMAELRPEEKALRRRIEEFDGKIFTNQKAGVDLLRAVLVQKTRDFAKRLAEVRVKSKLLKPLHRRKVAAYDQLAKAYQLLLEAYPREDFEAIKKGLKQRERAMRALAKANLALARMIRQYQDRKKKKR